MKDNCFKYSPANIVTGLATIWFCAGIRNLSLHFIQTIPGLTSPDLAGTNSLYLEKKWPGSGAECRNI